MDGYQNSQGNGSRGGGGPLGPGPRAPRPGPPGPALGTRPPPRPPPLRAARPAPPPPRPGPATGRSRPSPGLVLRLCEVLGVPPREADGVLLAAGHAPAHRETPLEAPAMAEVLAALRLILARHDPLPAVAFDAGWDIVMFNAAY